MRCNKYINVLGIVLLNVIYMVLVYKLRVFWTLALRNPDNLTLYGSRCWSGEVCWSRCRCWR